MIETAQAFGVDIGGSGIKAAPVNLEKGEFAEPRLKILTPEVSTPKAVGEIVRQQLEHFEVPESAPVGIAFPAPIHVGEKLGYMANLDQSWVGVDVTEVFSEACGRPVTVVNDADAAGLAEQQFGAAKGQDGLVVATTLGTGIGTALIFNALRKAMPKNEKLACFLGGLSAPVLNTVFFMGFLVLIFYNCDYVQNLANTLGAQNAFMFIVLLVGVQAIFEWAICCVVAGAVSLPVRKYLKMN